VRSIESVLQVRRKIIIAVMQINVLDFMLHLVESWEPRGRFSRTTAKEQVGGYG